MNIIGYRYKGFKVVGIGDTHNKKRIVSKKHGCICESMYLLSESDVRAEVNYYLSTL